MNESLNLLVLLEILFSIILLVIIILTSIFFIKKLVQPIVQITEFAKVVNQTALSLDKRKNIKKKTNVDIDEIKVFNNNIFLLLIYREVLELLET